MRVSVDVATKITKLQRRATPTVAAVAVIKCPFEFFLANSQNA